MDITNSLITMEVNTGRKYPNVWFAVNRYHRDVVDLYEFVEKEIDEILKESHTHSHCEYTAPVKRPPIMHSKDHL